MTTHDITRPLESDSEDDNSSQDFARALEDYERGSGAGHESIPAGVARDLAVGDKVQGRVVSIGDTHALVDHGGRSEAVADLSPFRNEDGTLRIAVGETLELFVVEAGDQITLAPVARSEKGGELRALREAQAAGMPVSGRVTGVNAGGLAVELGRVRGFCPVSQIDTTFVTDPSVFVGRTLEFLVTKVEDARGGVVLSRRQQLQREQKEQARRALAALKPGDLLEGKVARLEPFGAFVDLGGVDGLVHVSEIGHERVGHPRERLTEGQPVKVKVLAVESGAAGKTRISLSIKATLPDPWTGIEERFKPGMRVTGVVSRLADFGAFVNLAPGVDGLVHVSEAAMGHVKHVKDVLAAGDSIEAIVLAVDPVKKRISLSLKQAMSGEPPAPAAPPRARTERTREPASAVRPERAREPAPPAKPAAPPELTPMAIALRKAMEKARARQESQ
jgi:small subunit ribosomal protein S1